MEKLADSVCCALFGAGQAFTLNLWFAAGFAKALKSQGNFGPSRRSGGGRGQFKGGLKDAATPHSIMIGGVIFRGMVSQPNGTQMGDDEYIN